MHDNSLAEMFNSWTQLSHACARVRQITYSSRIQYVGKPVLDYVKTTFARISYMKRGLQEVESSHAKLMHLQPDSTHPHSQFLSSLENLIEQTHTTCLDLGNVLDVVKSTTTPLLSQGKRTAISFEGVSQHVPNR
jgi:hypothetical protein